MSILAIAPETFENECKKVLVTDMLTNIFFYSKKRDWLFKNAVFGAFWPTPKKWTFFGKW